MHEVRFIVVSWCFCLLRVETFEFNLSCRTMDQHGEKSLLVVLCVIKSIFVSSTSKAVLDVLFVDYVICACQISW